MALAAWPVQIVREKHREHAGLQSDSYLVIRLLIKHDVVFQALFRNRLIALAAGNADGLFALQQVLDIDKVKMRLCTHLFCRYSVHFLQQAKQLAGDNVDLPERQLAEVGALNKRNGLVNDGMERVLLLRPILEIANHHNVVPRIVVVLAGLGTKVGFAAGRNAPQWLS